MTIRERTLLLGGLTLVALLATVQALSQRFLFRGLTEMATIQVRRDAERFRSALDHEIESLHALNLDWAAWDSCYDFMAGTNSEDFIEENLADDTFLDLALSLCAFVRTNGTVAWGRSFDIEARSSAPLPEAILSLLGDRQSPLAQHDPASALSCILSLPDAPLLVSCQPILTSKQQGPVRGTLVMGRSLDWEASRISRILQVHVERMPAGDDEGVLERRGNSDDGSTWVVHTDDGHLDAFSLLVDVFHNPCAIYRIVSPTQILDVRNTVTRRFLLLLLAAGLVIGVASFVVQNQSVLLPLSRLSRSVRHVAAQPDLAQRVHETGDDEVATLASAINRLLALRESSETSLRVLNRDLEQRVNQRTEALRKSHNELQRLHRHVEEVRETERKRIAERVHDDLGQSMTILRMDLERLAELCPHDTPDAATVFDEIRATIDATTNAIRDIASELRPSLLDHLGISSAIQWLAARFADRSGIRISLDCPDVDPVLPTAAATVLFRSAQEIITNVVRHADASHVRIRIEPRPTDVTLEIRDDGRGIRPEDLDHPFSFGLTEIRERVASADGRITIDGRPGEGTRIVICLPLPDNPQPEGDDHVPHSSGR